MILGMGPSWTGHREHLADLSNRQRIFSNGISYFGTAFCGCWIDGFNPLRLEMALDIAGNRLCKHCHKSAERMRRSNDEPFPEG